VPLSLLKHCVPLGELHIEGRGLDCVPKCPMATCILLTLRDARAVKWRAQKKSTIQLVPDSDSLRLHLDRTKYLAHLPKHYHVQSHPSSIGHPWHLLNGLCVLSCSTQPHFPSMPIPTKPEAEKNSDGNGKRVDSEL